MRVEFALLMNTNLERLYDIIFQLNKSLDLLVASECPVKK